MESPRLLKVLVQPVFVAERDGDLIEVPVAAMTMTARQWSDLDPTQFAKEGAEQVAVLLDAQAANAPEGT